MNRNEHQDEALAGPEPAATPTAQAQTSGDENRNGGESNGLPTPRAGEPGPA